jgi:DNA-binding response OmpR family regulator
VLLPDQILESAWGPEYVGDEHLVRVYISHVRKKIEDDRSDPSYIVTRNGVGYTMKKPT